MCPAIAGAHAAGVHVLDAHAEAGVRCGGMEALELRQSLAARCLELRRNPGRGIRGPGGRSGRTGVARCREPHSRHAERPLACDRSRRSGGIYRAEDGGFEPPRAFTQHAFQACALGRYANPPGALKSRHQTTGCRRGSPSPAPGRVHLTFAAMHRSRGGARRRTGTCAGIGTWASAWAWAWAGGGGRNRGRGRRRPAPERGPGAHVDQGRGLSRDPPGGVRR